MAYFEYFLDRRRFMPRVLTLSNPDQSISARLELHGFVTAPLKDHPLYCLAHADLFEITNLTDTPFSISGFMVAMGPFEVMNTRVASCAITEGALRFHTHRGVLYSLPDDLDYDRPFQLPYLRARESVMGIVLFLHPKAMENEYANLYLSQAPLVYKCRIAGTDITLQAG